MANAHFDIYRKLPLLPEVKAKTISDLWPKISENRPFIVRQLVSDWPLVQAAQQSDEAAQAYLIDKAIDRPFAVSIGDGQDDGRIFYNEDMNVNFKIGQAKLPVIFDQMNAAAQRSDTSIIYMGSIGIKTHFDALDADCRLEFADRRPLESIWIGNKSRIAAHNDFSQNLACVAAGQRRFTLFPPEQFSNLYIGPLENTPASRPISMVDFLDPDFDKFPRFAEALKHGAYAVLEPGDAIYIPPLWWHQVEGLSAFNILVNFWWREGLNMGMPQDALYHAIMSIRDLPSSEKTHFRDLFDYYIFDNDDQTAEHIPEHGRGILGPMTADNINRLRSYLIRKLTNG